MSEIPSKHSCKFSFSNENFFWCTFFICQWPSTRTDKSFLNWEHMKNYLKGSWCCLWYLGMVYDAPIPHGPNQHMFFDHVRCRTSGAQVIEPLTLRSFKSSAIFLSDKFFSEFQICFTNLNSAKFISRSWKIRWIQTRSKSLFSFFRIGIIVEYAIMCSWSRINKILTSWWR